MAVGFDQLKLIEVKLRTIFLVTWLGLIVQTGWAQCGGILEPGFAFLTSSRGCAPFTVNIQTLYLSSVPGTQYFINWGDGTPEEMFTQVNPTGVTISHTYPNTSVNCGYDVTIDASNACNPRGSVVPIQTQVIVWTNDVVDINPQVFRVCQGFATDVRFTDDSDWNCFPRATRENNEPRWIQWIYGTGVPANQIPAIRVNGVLPGAFPYFNPAPGQNPIYPVLAPGQVSLPIQVPVTVPADVGREFEVTLRNWNQCNPYDNVVTDGNPFNPVSGNTTNGDNLPQVTTARIVIVPTPQPDFITRLGGPAGPVRTVFCIGDNIFFDDQTPPIAGAGFQYTWQFFDNDTGAGAPLTTRTSANPTFAYGTSGQKLIRLQIRDGNAAGNCVATVDRIITVSPSLVAQIATRDVANNPITPDFCQEAASPFSAFTVRFADISLGTVTPSTQWRWEFYNENNVLIRQEPASDFSSTPLGPFDQSYTNRGIYRVRLIVRDNITTCQTVDEIQVRVFEKPVPQFTATRICEGQATTFAENSTLASINGESIVMREWDFNYNGTTFNKDASFDNQVNFARALGPPGSYTVALRVTTDQNGCSSMVTQTLVVDPLPLAQFTPSVTSGCSVLTVVFTNNSVSGQPDVIDRFVWEVDDRMGGGFQPVSTQRPTDPLFTNSFTYDFDNVTTANRMYDVRLRVVTVNGCERLSTPVTITAFPGTRSGFSSPGYSPFNSNCSPVMVNFFVDGETQALTPVDYRWRIEDGVGVVSDVSTGASPNYTFVFSNATNLIQDYRVTLTSTLATGCFGDSTRTIRVSPVPTSLFTIDTLVFDCQRMRIRATATQTGLPEYHWVVRENGLPLLNTINSLGFLEWEVARPLLATNSIAVTIELETTNLANCSSIITSLGYVVPGQDPINASFIASPTTQSLPESTITINNTTNPGPWQYRWDFGDGNSFNGPTPPPYTYGTYGQYIIQLTVTNGACVEVATQAITINAIPPIVDFAYDPPFGCEPLTVAFTNLSQFAEPNTYEWDFGDGVTSRAVNPVHTYVEPGVYSVRLSASNITNQRVTETKQAIIQVYAKPIAAFQLKPAVIYIPGGRLYTNNQSFGASQFEWDFGDGSTSALPEPEHRYATEGFFTVTLVASTADGCRDTARQVNAVRVEKGGQILVPNAFSPGLGPGFSGSPGLGADGKNDVFRPLTRGITSYELLIFNRWGGLLFVSNDPELGWDGTYNGQLCPQDVYVYRVTGFYETGERVVRVGDVNLIR